MTHADIIPDTFSPSSASRDPARIRRFASLRSRLVLAFIFTVILPVSGLSMILVVSGTRSAQEETNRQLSTIVSFKGDAVAEWGITLKAVLGNALVGENILVDAQNSLSAQTDPAKRASTIQSRGRLRAHLLRLVSGSPYFYEYLLLDPLGKVALATNPGREGQNYSDRTFFQEGRKHPFVDAPAYFQAERNTYLFVSYPIYAEGSSNQERPLIGILVGRAKLDSLQNVLNDRTGLRQRGKSYLTSGDGRVLASSNSTETGRQVVGLLPIVTNIAEQIESGVPGIAPFKNLEDIPVNSAFQYLAEPRSILVVEQSQEDILRARLISLAVNLSVTLASIIIALYIAVSTTRNIVAPVTELVQVATTITQIHDASRRSHAESGNESTEWMRPEDSRGAATSNVPVFQAAAAELRERAADWEDEFGLLAGAFNNMTLQLAALITGLEERIAERTRQLEQRSNFLQASADVSRAATSILDPQKLLSQAVELIRDRFDLYYVGLFLVDTERRYATLRAGTGEAGRILILRGHRLAIEPTSMIGWCITNAQARIAQMASADPMRYVTLELPETRSELALPLRARGLVSGALSVQSSLANAFDPAAIGVLQTLADQLAIAIDNAMLFEQNQQALEAERRAYALNTRAEWQKLFQAGMGLTVRGDEDGIHLTPGMSANAFVSGGQIADGNTEHGIVPATRQVTIPIQVRGTTIGYIRANKAGRMEQTAVLRPAGSPATSQAQWSAEEMAFIDNISEQLGLALDSARLYAETRQLADQERLVGEITSRMRATLDMQTVLETAAQELRAALNLEEVQVRLGMEKVESSPEQDGNL